MNPRESTSLLEAAGRRLTLLLVAVLLLGGCAQRSPDEQLAAAQALYDRGEITSATLELKSLLQEHPEHAEARLLLGTLYSETGDPRGAEMEFSRALDAGLERARVLPALARALVLQGEPKRVLTEIDPDAVRDPDARAAILAARGQAHLALREPTEAKASLEKALELVPEHVDARLGKARWFASEGRLEDALTEVERALASAPKAAEAHMLKGDLLRAAKRLEEARSAYLAVLQNSPGHVQGLLALVSLEIAAGRFDDAQTHLAALRKAAPRNVMGAYFQALIHFRKREFRAAQDAIAAVLKVAPNHLPSVLVGGAVEFALGSQELAQARLKYVLERAPSNAYARRLLIASYARSGQTLKASELLQPVLKQGTKDPAVLALAGEVYLQLNEYEKSQKFFEQAAALDPSNPAMRTGLGLSRLAAGDVESATAELQSASELDASKHHADVLLIATHLQRRQYPQALKAAQALEAKQPNNPMTYNLMAAAQIGSKDVAAARRSLEKALTLQPGYTPAALNLAQLDLQEGNKAAARKRFEDIIARDRSNVQAYMALASLGPRIDATTEEIRRWLEAARRESPGTIQPLVMLARLHFQGGEPKKALEVMEQAVLRAPENPEVLELAGQVQLAAGERNRAVRTWGKLVSLQPDSALALYRLATAQYATEDVTGAIGSLRKAVQLREQFPEAKALLADLEARQGRQAAGIKIAQELQRDQSAAPLGWMVEGDIRTRAREYALAAAAYQKAHELAASGAIAVKLHAALAQSGRASEGERILREWLKRSPHDDAVRLYLGESYLAAGKHKNAIEQYEALLVRHPNNVVALNNLAWSYQQVRDARAAETARKALALKPEEPAVLDTLGWILIQNGEHGPGVELLQKAAAKAVNVPDIRFHYAVGLMKAGNRYRAKEELERLLLDFPKFPQHEQASKLLAQLKANPT